MTGPDLKIKIGGWTLKNPIMTASGTFGYGEEFTPYLNLEDLGAVVVKGISLEPRSGNPPPRIVETPCGMLNAIGLENVGLEKFISTKMQIFRKYNTDFVVNILGDSVEEYSTLAARLNDTDIAAIEVNISCPNVKKGGVAFGVDPQMAYEVTQAVRRRTDKPLIIKLSPNVTDITVMAKAAEDGGADAVSLINTLLGMAIDPATRKPKLANIVGGLSGPAIKPVALRMVWQASKRVRIPVIGIGGIRTTEDVIEFMLAGASAVQIGTANLIDPGVSGNIVKGLLGYLKQHKISSVRELIGGLKTP
ncbi:MAG: dihydroorotate dehydrogenase [Desulfobulbaceae bacterium]|uniref:Dihydroorotate dehydrogenase n=1 Tax=Candidatus Desulfobia pelagia TaxID=2841692 RepID=A0A8J6NGR4_9BACT|nr:dihydroorotate dehydrogenase [Candidatus Desulfobia pelagia]